MGERSFCLTGATLVTPDQICTRTAIAIHGDRIAALERQTSPYAGSAAYCLDMQDHVILPGLINAHDHLNGTWWPRVGPNRPYANVYEWLADLDESPVRYDREQNSVADVYELGMYRNLISGVTTVADHFKRLNGPEFFTRHPIHILYEYGRTWTPRELTAWGNNVPTEYVLAARTGWPYIIHLAEGLDPDTAAEMDVLLKFNAVGRNTLIIHGIALRASDMALLARAGASVCWCPESNLYLYGQTAQVPALFKAGANVTLGTDSSLTGGLNLLAELATARQVWREQQGEDIPARRLVELVTTRAAYALMLDNQRGRLSPGYEADLLVLPAGGADPHAALVEADMGDIALLICRGIPVYGDVKYHALFEQFSPGFSEVMLAGKSRLIAGDLHGLMLRMSQAVGRELEFPFLPCAQPSCTA